MRRSYVQRQIPGHNSNSVVLHVNLKSEQQNDLIGDCRQISLTDAHERILKEDRMRYSKMEDTLVSKYQKRNSRKILVTVTILGGKLEWWRRNVQSPLPSPWADVFCVSNSSPWYRTVSFFPLNITSACVLILRSCLAEPRIVIDICSYKLTNLTKANFCSIEPDSSVNRDTLS